jgi:hypothetical protein
VFTHIPRTGAPNGTSTSTRLKKVGAALGAVALATGLSLVPVPANAEEATASYAEGQFLSGTLLGADLANAIELAAAEARNDGTQDKQTSQDPLSASVLQTVDVEAPQGVQIPLDSFVDAGAVNQYAEADRNGVSMGSSGAIGDDGAIGAGSVGSGSAGDLDFDIEPLLGDRFDSVVADLRLSLEAVEAQANGNRNTASGDYLLDGATLIFSSPAISGLTGRVNTALIGVDRQLLALGTDDGLLGNVVDEVLDPVLGILGSSANVTVSIDADVQAAVQSLLTGAYGNGGVSFNLQTGEVSVDLAAFHGGDLNNLPVNTELLTDEIVSAILTSITDTVSTLADQIVDRVELALHDAKVDVHADLNLLTDGGVTQTEQCTLQQVPIIGDIVGDGLLDGILGGITQGIIGTTTETVCELVDTALPSLESTVVLDIEGSVDQILSGVAAQSSATISLLGGTVNTALDINTVLDGLADGLLDGLFDSDSVISDVTTALNANLVDPAVQGLLGDTGVGTLLSDLISVRVNLQETRLASPMGTAVATGSMFTQTAVRLTVLPGAGSAAIVNVAAATVGPNVTRVVDPGCTVDCDPDPDPCTVNCGSGDPDGPTTPAANRLAYTGVGIGILIAVILALLAAGAHLAREGYRRTHPESTS